MRKIYGVIAARRGFQISDLKSQNQCGGQEGGGARASQISSLEHESFRPRSGRATSLLSGRSLGVMAAAVTLLVAAGVRAQTPRGTQVANQVFDSLNDALRVNVVADGGGGGPSSSFLNLDQLLNLAFDSTNGALKVNAVAGLPCVFTGTGGITCAATGTNQNITLTPSGTGSTILNGNAGIGTSTPNSGGFGGTTTVLDIGNSSAGGVVSIRDGTTQGGMQESGGEMWIGTVGSGGTAPVNLVSGNGTPRMTILGTNGNVGIGTTTPSVQLQATKSMASGLNVVIFSATPTFDASLGNIQEMTLSGNVTSFTIPNAVAGEHVTFIFLENATGGYTVSGIPANVHGWAAISTTANTYSRESCNYDGTNWICNAGH
jgi:hypothetical protein